MNERSIEIQTKSLVAVEHNYNGTSFEFTLGKLQIDDVIEQIGEAAVKEYWGLEKPRDDE